MKSCESPNHRVTEKRKKRNLYKVQFLLTQFVNSCKIRVMVNSIIAESRKLKIYIESIKKVNFDN